MKVVVHSYSTYHKGLYINITPNNVVCCHYVSMDIDISVKQRINNSNRKPNKYQFNATVNKKSELIWFKSHSQIICKKLSILDSSEQSKHKFIKKG